MYIEKMMDYHVLSNVEYYKEDLEKIASRNIWEKISVRGIGLSRKAIQQAYKDKKQIDFKGDIIDYLGYVCLYKMLSMLVYMYKEIKNIKLSLKFFVVFLNQDNYVKIPLCRLVLKDETYVDYFFKVSTTLPPDDKLIPAVKEVIIKEINSLMKVEPRKNNKSNKLKSS